jgi:hypothetical protein
LLYQMRFSNMKTNLDIPEPVEIGEMDSIRGPGGLLLTRELHRVRAKVKFFFIQASSSRKERSRSLPAGPTVFAERLSAASDVFVGAGASANMASSSSTNLFAVPPRHAAAGDGTIGNVASAHDRG